VTEDLGTARSRSYRRDALDDDPTETFGDAEEVAASAALPIVEWGIDVDGSSHPTTEHQERITWHLAPSRILIRPTEECYRVSYDMDLLPIQAGSYASDEEETEYLDTNLDGGLINGVKLEMPEMDDDFVGITEDRPDLVRSIQPTGPIIPQA